MSFGPATLQEAPAGAVVFKPRLQLKTMLGAMYKFNKHWQWKKTPVAVQYVFVMSSAFSGTKSVLLAARLIQVRGGMAG